MKETLGKTETIENTSNWKTKLYFSPEKLKKNAWKSTEKILNR